MMSLGCTALDVFSRCVENNMCSEMYVECLWNWFPPGGNCFLGSMPLLFNKYTALRQTLEAATNISVSLDGLNLPPKKNIMTFAFTDDTTDTAMWGPKRDRRTKHKRYK